MASSPPGTMIHHHSRTGERYVSEGRPAQTAQRTTPKPLNFSKAMNDFSTMFPELDRNVIETVLRANNGVVQSTIDQLLVLQESTIDENTNTGLPNLPSYESSISGDIEPPPPYTDIWHDVPSPNSTSTARDQETAQSRHRFWNAPLVGKLPDDFLRLQPVCQNKNNSKNNRNQRHSNSSTSEEFMTEEEIERFLEDEKLAMFLQNEEFVRELRRNQEFVSSLEADHKRAISSGETVVTQESLPSGGARPRTQGGQDDVAFRQKLKHMGKSTRKKFSKMARRFSKTKNSSKLPPIHGGESTLNLLEDDPDEPESQLALDGIQENDSEDEYDGDVDTEEDVMRQSRIRAAGRTNRQLPVPPGSQSSGTDEPIVFYSEDNEFSYKSD